MPRVLGDHWFAELRDALEFRDNEQKKGRVAILLPYPGEGGGWRVIVVQ